MVVREYRSGRVIRYWQDDLASMAETPFSAGDDSLFAAYFASAELGCFLAQGWSLPTRILDLYVEFRNVTNGLPTPCGNSLLGALTYYGIDCMLAVEKDEMRGLAMRGGPYTKAEQVALLNYCQEDVDALGKLLPKMLPTIDLPRALLRGRYMTAVARMEFAGVPIDVDTLGALRANWTAIAGRITSEIDKDYGVFIPPGKRLDQNTEFGRAVLQEAEASGVDPFKQADAARYFHDAQRQSRRDIDEALSEARKQTGLNARSISRWEDAGHDHSTFPRLDETARELASSYPALGIGTGYDVEAGYDDTDYAGRLWDLLREGSSTTRPRHDPEVLRQAADAIAGDETPIWVTERLSFSMERWARWLAANNIPWPRLETGALDMRDETFRQMARQHPEVAPIRELRHTLSQMRLNSLAVGSDGRNRCLLSPFRARTSRNQPSNAKFIFGPSCWLRGLIQPEPGRAVAYVDWEQQEFGIAAALSGDTAMMDAYASGDPYLAFALQANAVPANATKESHPRERGTFKVCALAVQYGMGPKSLAESLGEPEALGRQLLRLHQQTYRRFWAWSEGAVNHAMLRGWLYTVFGWRIHVGPNVNPRSLANFPMQANGAEMLRLACCLATEQGIEVVAPVHDAVLIVADDRKIDVADVHKIDVADVREIDVAVADMQRAMAEASRVVLDGFELRTNAKIVRYPDRYMDPRGAEMWAKVLGILGGLPEGKVHHSGAPRCTTVEQKVHHRGAPV